MNPLDVYKDIFMNHWQEIVMVIGGYIIFYMILASISKPKFKELHLQKVGVWRASRRIGHIVWIENMHEFMNPHTKHKAFVAYLYRKRSILTPKWIVMWMVLKWARKGVVTSQTKKVIIDRQTVAAIQQTRIVVDKKCIVWDTKLNMFILMDQMPATYAINPEYIERWILNEIDNIDTKSTKAARSSPPVVHTNLTQRSIPLSPDDYKEQEKDSVEIDIDKIIKKKGEYKRQIQALKSRDSRQMHRRPLPMNIEPEQLEQREADEESEKEPELPAPRTTSPPVPEQDYDDDDEVDATAEELEEEIMENTEKKGDEEEDEEDDD